MADAMCFIPCCKSKTKCPDDSVKSPTLTGKRIPETWRALQAGRNGTSACLDLHEAVAWAERQERRWSFTLSNAGSLYFKDRCDLEQLGEIDWDAVNARMWSHCKEEKQAEFLVERSFPWTLVQRVGVRSLRIQEQARHAVRVSEYQPAVDLRPEWYY